MVKSPEATIIRPQTFPLHIHDQVVSVSETYDAILFVSFGGPEGREDVIPFLENVLRGRNVPRERMLEVAEHYYHFEGVSPINAQNRSLIEAVRNELAEQNITLPIYWGNRNWDPMLPDTIAQMTRDGVRKAIAFVTAAYSSYSSCRQYRENVYAACDAVGDQAPTIDKIRTFYNHPDFIAANAARLQEALEAFSQRDRDQAHIAFTAHSIPMSMSNQCDYVQQLEETCRLVAEQLQIPDSRWRLVYQSRSGRPQDPWLEPDILDHLESLHEESVTHVAISPIGFISDHMEVMYDLDEEAAEACDNMSMHMSRAQTVGTHPLFVKMVAKLIRERVVGDIPREAIGNFPPNWDVCPSDCCPAPRRRPSPGSPKA